MSDLKRLLTWRELPGGGVILAGGNSEEYETGTWRTWRPVFQPDNCTGCLTCWVFCPEGAILLGEETRPDGKTRRIVKGIDYFHCKGCGLCVRECPVNKKGKHRALLFEKEEM